MSEREMVWLAIPVIVDNSIGGLFEMPTPDEDPGQKPAFIVTQSTADLVGRDFERYRPSLVRMLAAWQEEKGRIMRARAHGRSTQAGQRQ